MKLFTAAEVALSVGCDESTIRRQAARAWDSNGGPGPLAKHPGWRVVRRSAPEGGQGCGWLLERSEELQSIKQQALIVLDDISSRLDAAHENIIRRALESLPDPQD